MLPELLVVRSSGHTCKALPFHLPSEQKLELSDKLICRRFWSSSKILQAFCLILILILILSLWSLSSLKKIMIRIKIKIRNKKTAAPGFYLFGSPAASPSLSAASSHCLPSDLRCPATSTHSRFNTIACPGFS